MPTARGPRASTLLGLFAGGVVLGLVGGPVTSLRRTIGGIDVSWGVALALVAVACCVRGAAWLVGTRRGSAVVAIGWLGATITLAVVSPGGDVLLPDLPRTYVYLAGGVFLSLLAVVWPLPEGAAEGAYPSHDALPDHGDAEPGPDDLEQHEAPLPD